MPHSNEQSPLLENVHTIRAKLNYLDKTVTEPYYYSYAVPESERKTNVVIEEKEVTLTDLNSIPEEGRKELGFDTDHAGFELIRGFGKEATREDWANAKWEDEEWIKQVYYADVDALLKRLKGATYTFVFDHTIRKRKTEETKDLPEHIRQPGLRVHVDQSNWAGQNRVLKHLGPEAHEKLKRGEIRAQLINVWRPLRGPVFDHPLAVADFRSVPLSDLVPSELRYPTWTGQTLSIYPNPVHRWYYARGMEAEQALLLKCYDSTDAVLTPHSAFVDPTTPPDALPRWSIELRVLAITELTA